MQGVQWKTLQLGEVVDANRMASTPYLLNYLTDRLETVCEKSLSVADLKTFRKAVQEDWYFQMYYDDLPGALRRESQGGRGVGVSPCPPRTAPAVWGFIGKMEKIISHGTSTLRYYLFTHIEFDIKYNGDKVIEINVSTNPEQAVDISADTTDLKVKFTYSVRWIPVATTWEKRLQRYERFPLNPVHLEASQREDDVGRLACMRPHACMALPRHGTAEEAGRHAWAGPCM